LAKLGADPFDPPPWQYVGGNRFDDPDSGFRVIYCAAERAGAFGETLARFRRSLGLLALMTEVESDEPLPKGLEGLIDPSDPRRGVVPTEWRLERQLGTTLLSPELEFADIAAPENVERLRTVLAPLAHRHGLSDFDLSTVLSSSRDLTQPAARYVYEQTGDDGRPRFAGIRYPSRLNLDWTCWAVFADRMVHQPLTQEATIDPYDPALLEAARLLRLSIEIIRGGGHYISP
jgi:hypothetical protein